MLRRVDWQTATNDSEESSPSIFGVQQLLWLPDAENEDIRLLHNAGKNLLVDKA
jgi:hypothetical protein